MSMTKVKYCSVGLAMLAALSLSGIAAAQVHGGHTGAGQQGGGGHGNSAPHGGARGPGNAHGGYGGHGGHSGRGDGGWHRGGSAWWGLGLGLGLGWELAPHVYPYSPYGDYYYPYSPPVVVVEPAPVELPSNPPATANWYYCESAKAYYPYVRQCPEAWLIVPARPPER
ncbi:MAG TPA: hypothetical protein VIF60_07135 [Burkholderiaceae bacterium]